MKIRSGFVSNSSSSSFILDGSKFTVDKLKSAIKNVMIASNIVTPEECIHIDPDLVCEIHEEKTGINFLKQVKAYEAYYEDERFFNKEDYDKPVIIIDSVSNNSIPWSVQEFLERIAILRQHWG